MPDLLPHLFAHKLLCSPFFPYGHSDLRVLHVLLNLSLMPAKVLGWIRRTCCVVDLGLVTLPNVRIDQPLSDPFFLVQIFKHPAFDCFVLASAVRTILTAYGVPAISGLLPPSPRCLVQLVFTGSPPYSGAVTCFLLVLIGPYADPSIAQTGGPCTMPSFKIADMVISINLFGTPSKLYLLNFDFFLACHFDPWTRVRTRTFFLNYESCHHCHPPGVFVCWCTCRSCHVVAQLQLCALVGKIRYNCACLWELCMWRWGHPAVSPQLVEPPLPGSYGSCELIVYSFSILDKRSQTSC